MKCEADIGLGVRLPSKRFCVRTPISCTFGAGPGIRLRKVKSIRKLTGCFREADKMLAI